MITSIKKFVDNFIGNFIPVKLDEDAIKQYADCRFDTIKHLVTDVTNIDVCDIPLEFSEMIPSNAYTVQTVAAYMFMMLDPRVVGSQHLLKADPQERIAMRTDLMADIALPRKMWPMFIGSILAHELFHASDARRDSSVFTKYIPGENYNSIREQYTEWRAEKAVTDAFYPGRSNYAAVSALRNIVSIDNSRKFKILENQWTSSLEDLESL